MRGLARQIGRISRIFREIRCYAKSTCHRSIWHALIAVLSGSFRSGYSWVGWIWVFLGWSGGIQEDLTNFRQIATETFLTSVARC